MTSAQSFEPISEGKNWLLKVIVWPPALIYTPLSRQIIKINYIYLCIPCIVNYFCFGHLAKILSIMSKSFPDSSMPPNQWRLTSSWTKPRPEASLAHGASSSNLDECGPKALAQNPLSVPKTPSAHPQQMWHFSPLARPDFLEPAYFRVFPDRHPAPEVYHGRRRGSFLHFLQQDRYLNHQLEPAARENCNPAKTAGSSGLHGNLPPKSEHCKEMLTDTCKVIVVGSELTGHEGLRQILPLWT